MLGMEKPLEPKTTTTTTGSRWEEEFRRYKDSLRIKREQRAKIISSMSPQRGERLMMEEEYHLPGERRRSLGQTSEWKESGEMLSGRGLRETGTGRTREGLTERRSLGETGGWREGLTERRSLGELGGRWESGERLSGRRLSETTGLRETSGLREMGGLRETGLGETTTTGWRKTGAGLSETSGWRESGGGMKETLGGEIPLRRHEGSLSASGRLQTTTTTKQTLESEKLLKPQMMGKTETTSHIPEPEEKLKGKTLSLEEESLPEKKLKESILEEKEISPTARSAGIQGSYGTEKLEAALEEKDLKSEEYGIKLIKSQWVPSKTVVLRDEVGIAISPEPIEKFPVKPEDYFPEVGEEIHLGIEDETELIHRIGVKCGIHLQALTRDLNRLTTLVEGPVVRPYRKESISCLVNLLDSLDEMDLEIKTLLHNLSRDQRERELILKQMLSEEEEDEAREIEALRNRTFDRIVKERVIIPVRKEAKHEIPERPKTSFTQEKVEVPIEEKAPEVQIVEKEVIKEVPVEKEIIKEVPVEKEVIKEVPVEKEIIKEVPVVKEVIKEVEVPKEVEVVREVIKKVPEIHEIVKEVPKEVEVVREVIKEVPVEREVIKEVPVIQEVIKEVPKEVEVVREIIQKVPEIQEVEREVIKEVPVEREVIKEVPVEREVIKEVPVEKEVIKEVEVIKEIPVEKEIIKEVPVIKEIPIQQVIQPDIKQVQTEEIITEKRVTSRPEILETGRIIEERRLEPELQTETLEKPKETITKISLPKEKKLEGLGTSKWGTMECHPSFDIQESQNSLILSSYLPGLKKDLLHLDVGKDYFTIEGLKEPTLEEESKLRKEGSLQGEKDLDQFLSKSGKFGTFSETFRLPSTVDSNKIKASYQGGVLQVICPKTEMQTQSAF